MAKRKTSAEEIKRSATEDLLKKTSSTTGAQDLLGSLARKNNIDDPSIYLKTSDLYESPELSNEDYYPNAHRPLQVGSSPSTYFGGGIPIFVGEGRAFPMAPIAKRQAALDRAAVQAKLYNMKVDEGRRASEDAAKKGLNAIDPQDKEVPMVYNMDYRTQGLDIVKKYRAQAEAEYGNSVDALSDLNNWSSGKYGAKMAQELLAHKVWGENLNQASKVSNNIDESVKTGKFVPDGLRMANDRFKRGEMRGANAQQIALDITSMSAMNNLLPELDAFNNVFDSTKTASGFHYVNPKNVMPSARGFVKGQVDSGQRLPLTAALGLSPDATEEQMAKALTDQVVKKHATQQDRMDDGSGMGEGKDARFTWTKGTQMNRAATQTTLKADDGAIKIDVAAPAKSPVVGDGYSFQYLSSGGETTPNKGWKASYSIDPITGDVSEKVTSVSGQLTGVVPAYNKKTGKTEWMAEISVPAHKEQVIKKQEFTDKDGEKQSFDTVETIDVPDKSTLIPYDENSTEVEVHTRDKRGQNGFVLSESDRREYASKKRDEKPERTYSKSKSGKPIYSDDGGKTWHYSD